MTSRRSLMHGMSWQRSHLTECLTSTSTKRYKSMVATNSQSPGSPSWELTCKTQKDLTSPSHPPVPYSWSRGCRLTSNDDIIQTQAVTLYAMQYEFICLTPHYAY